MKRIIARLDIKGTNVIKGVHLEGLKIVGDPKILSKKYSDDGADEIYFHDTVASLYRRNNLFEIIEGVSSSINIPLTVSGGLRSVADIEKALISGADKVSLNTIFHEDPSLIKKVVETFGSQAIVASVEAKKIKDQWIAFTDNGRTNTNKNVLEWINFLQDSGVGELLVTSIDFEGTKKGFDDKLLIELNKITKVPLILSGGFGTIEHIKNAYKFTKVTGTAIATMIHYNEIDIKTIKKNIDKKFVTKNFFIKKKNKKLSILNSKTCNIRSLYNSLTKICDVDVINSISPENIDRLVIPGVGSFNEFSKEVSLETKENIKILNKNSKPILGICLGAQFLFTRSFEFGLNAGLDLIKGDVLKINDPGINKEITTPNIGWWEIEENNEKLFLDIPINSKYYFIHSYNFYPDESNLFLSKIKGANINAICKKNNLIACQFHPEKSGNQGQKFLDNFINFY